MNPSILKYLASATIILLAMPASADRVQCGTPVTISVKANAEKGDFSSAIQLKDIALSLTTIGYGATANLGEEVTIVDGRIYLSRNDHGAVKLRSSFEQTEGAYKLISASPAAWRAPEPLAGIASVEELNALIERVAGRMQCQETDQIAFKIKGRASSVVWSVVNRVPGADFVSTSHDVEVMLVGIFSKVDKERLSIGKGSVLHVHVYMPQENLAGHVKQINLDGGAQLYLPVAQ